MSNNRCACNSNPWTWAQCDKCYKWRRLPPGFDKQLPEVWFCYMNHDAVHKFVQIFVLL